MSNFINVSQRPEPGSTLSRQLSSSHIQPRSLSGYQDFFRQNSNPETGWLDVMISDSAGHTKQDKWEHAWVAFENRNLSFSHEAAGSYHFKVPMDLVMSFKIDSGSVKHDIAITTTDRQKIMLRCPNADEMKKWLFTFQKSVALVYSHLVGSTKEGSVSTYGSLTSSGASLTGIAERRGLEPFEGAMQDTPSKRRSSVDDSTERAETSAFSTNLLKGAEAQRAIHSIESGIGMNNDYNSYLISRPAPAFGKMESIKPDSSMNALSGGDSSFGIMQKRRNSLSDGDTGSGTGMSRAAESSNNLMMHRSSPRETEGKKISMEANTIELKTAEAAHSAQRGSYYNSMAASSPAIPIHMNDSPYGGRGTLLADGTLRQSFDAPKVAGSYDELNVGMLAKAVEALDAADPSSDLDSLDGSISDGEDSLGDDAGDMMFDLEESNGSLKMGKSGRNSMSPSEKSAGTGHSHRSGEKDNNMSSPGSASTTPGSKAKKDKDKRTRSTDGTGAISPASFLSNLRVGGDADSDAALSELVSAIDAGPLAKPSLSWYCGSCSKLGPRNSNEDRYVAINDLITFSRQVPQAAPPTNGTASTSSSTNRSRVESPGFSSQAEIAGKGSSVGFYAVYDGHCGYQAAQFLQDQLHTRIFKHPAFADNILKAVTDSCVLADNDFLDECEAKRIYCGTTCLGVFLRNNQLVVFNIGDCLAVMGRKDGTAKDLNDPHKPGRPDEEARIKAAKGWITEEKELYMGRLHRMDLSDPVVRDKAQKVSWVTIHRVCGELAVSRSIGDPDYKRFTPNAKVDALFNWPEGHDESFAADLVIPTPEVLTFDITAEDEFFIIASDGLWDVVSAQEAVTMVRETFKERFTPAEAAEELCELALKLGSSDNVTIVIVKLNHPQTE